MLNKVPAKGQSSTGRISFSNLCHLDQPEHKVAEINEGTIVRGQQVPRVPYHGTAPTALGPRVHEAFAIREEFKHFVHDSFEGGQVVSVTL